jgi:uncharacterized membrane protein
MRSFALVVAVVVVVVVAGGAKARRRGLVDNDDDDEDDIVASVDRSASDGRLNADRRISMILLLYVLASIGSMLPLAVFYSMGVDGVLLSFLSWS